VTNPCRSCARLDQDKNSSDCMSCTRRVEYVTALEGRSCSVPMEMGDMARQSSEKTRHDDQYLRDHQDTPIPEIAKALGRSVESIYVRRSNLGLTARRGLIKARAEKIAGERLKKPARPAPPTVIDQSEDHPDISRPAGTIERSTALIPAVMTPSADLFIMSFKGHEDLYDSLKDKAAAEFRTPELQALFIIHKALQAQSGAGDH
jgi:hypothetical protein